MRLPLLAGLALACGSSSKEDTAPQGGTVALADCEHVFEGVDWGDPPVNDAQPGIEAAMQAFDPDTLPTQIDIGSLMGMYRGQIAYALEIPLDELGESLDRDAALASGEMGKMVLASLSVNEDGETELDFALYRKGLLRYYACSKAFPLTLAGFKATYGALPSDYDDVDSVAKCGTRRLRVDHDRGMYVAETIIDGETREYEILMRDTRDDGQLDFVVYNANEDLADRSQFPTISGGDHITTAAPYVCMSCHFNVTAHDTAWGYDILLPTAGPCR